MTFNRPLRLRSQGVLAPITILVAGAFPAACGEAGPVSVPDGVETETARQEQELNSAPSADAGGRHEEDSDPAMARERERNRRPPRVCDSERCVEERHHGRWHHVCHVACTPGATQCSGNALQTCDAKRRWGAAVPCQYVCDAATGACTGVCAPGATQCLGNGVQTCEASGQWGAAVACVNQACDAATGACTGVCTPGATQCSGSLVLACSEQGQWTLGAPPCPYGCEAGACSTPPLPGCLQATYAIPYAAQNCTQRQDVPGTGCGPTQPPECYDASGTARIAIHYGVEWQVTILDTPSGPGAPGSGPFPLVSAGPGVWSAGTVNPSSGSGLQFQMDCGTGKASIQSMLPGSRISMCYFTLPSAAYGSCDAASCGGQ